MEGDNGGMVEVRYRVDRVGGIVYSLEGSGVDGFADTAGRLEVDGGVCAPLFRGIGDAEVGRVALREESCGQAGDVQFYLC